MAMEHMSETTKNTVDAISVVTVVGTLVELLPAVAALATIVWTCIRIYETNTIQKLVGKKKEPIKEVVE